MKVTILPSAWEDLAAGFRFYDRQQTGLGGLFPGIGDRGP